MGKFIKGEYQAELLGDPLSPDWPTHMLVTNDLKGIESLNKYCIKTFKKLPVHTRVYIFNVDEYDKEQDAKVHS